MNVIGCKTGGGVYSLISELTLQSPVMAQRSNDLLMK